MEPPKPPNIGGVPPARKHRQHEEDHPTHHDESNWLVSYADMMTLLFGFFVLMYSFSKVDTKKFEVVSKDMARSFGGNVKKDASIDKFEKEIRNVLKTAGLEKQVEVVARNSEATLQFQGSLLFRPGSADLIPEAQDLMVKVVTLIKADLAVDEVHVEGHTDDNPIVSLTYPSNWELSAARATRVVRQFETAGFKSATLRAEGYGSSRPILPNRDSSGQPVEENQSTNRRVLINISFSQHYTQATAALQTHQFQSLTDSAQIPEGEKSENDSPTASATPAVPLTPEQVAKQRLDTATSKLHEMEDKVKLAEEKRKAAIALAEAERKIIELRAKENELETQARMLLSDPHALDQMEAAKRAPAAAPSPTPTSATTTSTAAPTIKGKGANANAKAKRKAKAAARRTASTGKKGVKAPPGMATELPTKKRGADQK